VRPTTSGGSGLSDAVVAAASRSFKPEDAVVAAASRSGHAEGDGDNGLSDAVVAAASRYTSIGAYRQRGID